MKEKIKFGITLVFEVLDEVNIHTVPAGGFFVKDGKINVMQEKDTFLKYMPVAYYSGDWKDHPSPQRVLHIKPTE